MLHSLVPISISLRVQMLLGVCQIDRSLENHIETPSSEGLLKENIPKRYSIYIDVAIPK